MEENNHEWLKSVVLKLLNVVNDPKELWFAWLEQLIFAVLEVKTKNFKYIYSFIHSFT